MAPTKETGSSKAKSADKKKPTDKKEKKRVAPEEEEATGDAPVVEQADRERAEARKQKKQKKAAQPPPEQEPEEEEEEAGEEAGEDGEAFDEDAAKGRLTRRRQAKRASGYRTKAVECGFRKASGVVAASGVDAYSCALSLTEAKRLMRFVPEVLNKSSYDKSECAMRMKLSQESVPPAAARVTQARCEAALRKIMNEATLRVAERGVTKIDAATVQSVLRPYQFGMTFSSVVPPKGLIRHAQKEGVLTANLADEESAEKESAENKELVAAAKKISDDEAARKKAFAERKAAKAAA
jgi:hypothetical protein